MLCKCMKLKCKSHIDVRRPMCVMVNTHACHRTGNKRELPCSPQPRGLAPQTPPCGAPGSQGRGLLGWCQRDPFVPTAAFAGWPHALSVVRNRAVI